MRFSFINFIILFCISCTTSEYKRLEKEELRKGIRYDSLFQGLYLSMTRDQYFEHCLKKNKQEIFTNGIGNKVQYKIKELRGEAMFLFYPDYVDNKIVQLLTEVRYTAWAPWNKDFGTEALTTDLKGLLLKWYGGNQFIEIDHPDKPTVFVKIDGNRRITLIPLDDGRTKIIFRDLTISDAQIYEANK